MKNLRKQLGEEYLKKILPVYIEQKNNSKNTFLLNIYNEYIHLNRKNVTDNKYINLNIQNLSDIREDSKDFKRELLLNDGNKPWENKSYLNKLCEKLSKKRRQLYLSNPYSTKDKHILDINIEFLRSYHGYRMDDIKDDFGYKHLRKNIPYVIEINTNTKEAYLLNRDYEYIDLNTKSLRDICEDYEDFEREYLFNDGSKPWEDENNLKKIFMKLKKYLEETQILNMNEKITNLMIECDL